MDPDTEFLSLLLELTTALQTEANLHVLGRMAMRTVLLNNLIDKIYLEQVAKEHPEIAEIPVEVVVIAGLARTGTTLLHRLMSGPTHAPLAPHQLLPVCLFSVSSLHFPFLHFKVSRASPF